MDSLLTEYYNKFNEDKRLKSRHGQVESAVTMHFIREALELIRNERKNSDICIADIGAGTGGYAIPLAQEGYCVAAAELVKYNLGILKKNAKVLLGERYLEPEKRDTKISPKTGLTAVQQNAMRLKRFPDNSFDVTLLLGPLYHLHSIEDKVKALKEAKRITKPGGYIFVAYVMADYAVIKYGFMEGNIKESLKAGALREDYSVVTGEDDLYDYVRLSDIDEYNRRAELARSKIVAPDGAADYIRNVLNDMDEETFKLFIDYQIKNAQRPELLGASSHTLDILRKEN